MEPITKHAAMLETVKLALRMMVSPEITSKPQTLEEAARDYNFCVATDYILKAVDCLKLANGIK